MAFRLFALVVLAASLAASAAAASGPSLRMMREQPLELRGTAFKPGEAIRVTVRTSERSLTRKTKAGRRGGFTIEFRGVQIDFCSTPVRILAQGRFSGTVRARLPIRACPSP